MPAYFRVNIDGNWLGTPEVWSTSFATTAGLGDPDQEAMQGWADGVMSILSGSSAAAVRLRTLMSTVGQINQVRIYHYPSTSAPADAVAQSTLPSVTGSLTLQHPPQLAVVFSLYCAIPGRRYRGRMYWPATGVQTGSNFTSSTINQTLADDVADFLEAATDLAPGVDILQPAIVSKAGDMVTPVTKVSVDNVLDTQRRRRDALVGTRYFADVANT